MTILDKLTELSFLELRDRRIYTELGSDVTDELIGAMNAAAAKNAAAMRVKVEHILALIRQLRQRGITASELDDLESLVWGWTARITTSPTI